MTKQGRKKNRKPRSDPAAKHTGGGTAPPALQPPRPVDVIDGIADRASRPAVWKFIVIGAVFAAWVAFLVYCQIAGKPAS